MIYVLLCHYRKTINFCSPLYIAVDNCLFFGKNKASQRIPYTNTYYVCILT